MREFRIVSKDRRIEVWCRTDQSRYIEAIATQFGRFKRKHIDELIHHLRSEHGVTFNPIELEPSHA